MSAIGSGIAPMHRCIVIMYGYTYHNYKFTFSIISYYFVRLFSELRNYRRRPETWGTSSCLTLVYDTRFETFLSVVLCVHFLFVLPSQLVRLPCWER